jgi:hypothetical protein
MQKDLFDVYGHGSRIWLSRVKSEMDLWSELAAKLTASRSVPEAVESYQRCVAQRMQMVAEDGRQLIDECQKITQKISRSLSLGWQSAGG